MQALTIPIDGCVVVLLFRFQEAKTAKRRGFQIKVLLLPRSSQGSPILGGGAFYVALIVGERSLP